MTNFNLGLSSAVFFRSVAGTFQPTTTNPVINPTFTGTARVYGVSVPIDNSFSGLESAYDFETPGRPGSGQLYPRGNQ